MIKKRNPTHPGAILREHYIIPTFAEAIGISRKTLSKIIDEEASITPQIASKLSKTFKTSPEFWLNLQKKYQKE